MIVNRFERATINIHEKHYMEKASRTTTEFIDMGMYGIEQLREELLMLLMHANKCIEVNEIKSSSSH